MVDVYYLEALGLDLGVAAFQIPVSGQMPMTKVLELGIPSALDIKKWVSEPDNHMLVSNTNKQLEDTGFGMCGLLKSWWLPEWQ